MSSYTTVKLELRGVVLELEAPGEDADPVERMIGDVEMLVLALLAIENPAVDTVLRNFGFKLDGVFE